MANPAEQLAANFNFGALAKAAELKQRLLFVLGALIVYRIGTYIPLPGIDSLILQDIVNQNSDGILGMFNMFSGGALGRMSIFALNIIPYISASIIMQLMVAVTPSLEQLKKEGEQGRQKINQYTRYGTVFLAAVQGYALAAGLQTMTTSANTSAVLNPGFFFVFTTVVSIVGGTLFLVWLGEQITSRGIGNGISLIIFAGIVAELPRAIVQFFEFGRTGVISAGLIPVIIAIIVGVIAFIVFMERAQRRVVVQYPKRQVGNKMYGGDSSHMPLKLNTSGVIPPIFASSLLLLPLTIINFTGQPESQFWADVIRYLQHGQPIYMVLYGALIAFFAFFYTSIMFNAEETADNLRKYGGFIPGIRPGKNTADYLDKVLTRLTVVGAAYLVFVCLLPEFLMAEYSLPFYFGGTSLLIVVSVTMDTVSQIQSHLIAHQYEGLLKKVKLRGRR